MTTDTIYKEQGFHWSQQISAVATTRWLQTLPLCEGFGLQDQECALQKNFDNNYGTVAVIKCILYAFLSPDQFSGDQLPPDQLS